MISRNLMSLFSKLKIYGPMQFFKFSLMESKQFFYDRFIKNSYSQNNEDIIIDKILNKRGLGTYIDIGAYDPYRFNNTYRFYKKGWKGINIEPDEYNYSLLLKKRSNDVNLNIGIGLNEGMHTFYKFFPDTLSTFSRKNANSYKKGGFKFIEKRKIQIRKLSYIFSTYYPNRKVSFISIDTEGYELEILKSNDWNKHRPKVICIEYNEFISKSKPPKERLVLRKFIEKINYRLVFSNNTNSIYEDLLS